MSGPLLIWVLDNPDYEVLVLPRAHKCTHLLAWKAKWRRSIVGERSYIKERAAHIMQLIAALGLFDQTGCWCRLGSSRMLVCAVGMLVP